MSEKSNPGVAEVVWPWRVKAAGVDAVAARRRRALIQGSIMAAIGLLLMFALKRPKLGGVAVTLSALVLLGGFFVPAIFHAFDRFGRLLGKGAGTITTYLLLVPFYYVCLAPIHLSLRLRGKDPMNRRFERDRPSYWTDRPPVSGPEHYTRQY